MQPDSEIPPMDSVIASDARLEVMRQEIGRLRDCLLEVKEFLKPRAQMADLRNGSDASAVYRLIRKTLEQT